MKIINFRVVTPCSHADVTNVSEPSSSVSKRFTINYSIMFLYGLTQHTRSV
jgi:hypothetical protein